jgi:hypothetical protein
MAGPGDFTRRAFVNGKMTLSEAQAIGLLIDADTESRRALASGAARGNVSRALDRIATSLTEVLSALYAAIDYPEEDVGDEGERTIADSLSKAKAEVDRLLSTYKTGRAVADGVKCAVCGRPNVGKSSIFNLIVGDESAIVTDILALKRGQFTNISFSSEAQTSVQTLRNYYIYADDIDNDGVLELPSLIQPDGYDIHQPYLIRWFSMDLSGNETDKIHTYHNFTGGWYLELPGELAGEIYITQAANAFVFWHRQEADSKPLMSIYVLTGPNREDQALEEGRFVLHRGDGVLYAARLEPAGYALAWNQEEITNRFHLISHDWKTGET